VDSIHTVEEAVDAALILAKELGTTLAITGKVDLITDGRRSYRVMNGHELMGYVTGTGCTATAIIGAFSAADPDAAEAAATGLAYFGLAGEVAAQRAEGPGGFQIGVLDALFTLDGEALRKGAKIQT
jgi:hydroxyethylthiazole kinase